jgi:hypothetical protein
MTESRNGNDAIATMTTNYYLEQLYSRKKQAAAGHTEEQPEDGGPGLDRIDNEGRLLREMPRHGASSPAIRHPNFEHKSQELEGPGLVPTA